MLEFNLPGVKRGMATNWIHALKTKLAADGADGSFWPDATTEYASPTVAANVPEAVFQTGLVTNRFPHTTGQVAADLGNSSADSVDTCRSDSDIIAFGDRSQCRQREYRKQHGIARYWQRIDFGTVGVGDRSKRREHEYH